VGALVTAAFVSWNLIHSASFADYFVTAAILFLPFAALRLIISVGDALMDEESARNRKTGAEGHRL